MTAKLSDYKHFFVCFFCYRNSVTSALSDFLLYILFGVVFFCCCCFMYLMAVKHPFACFFYTILTVFSAVSSVFPRHFTNCFILVRLRECVRARALLNTLITTCTFNEKQQLDIGFRCRKQTFIPSEQTNSKWKLQNNPKRLFSMYQILFCERKIFHSVTIHWNFKNI